jgi:hypothetical protein
VWLPLGRTWHVHPDRPPMGYPNWAMKIIAFVDILKKIFKIDQSEK